MEASHLTWDPLTSTPELLMVEYINERTLGALEMSESVDQTTALAYTS